MNFELFSQLYQEASEHNDLEIYIMERGWQEWMNDFEPDKIAGILEEIYNLNKSDMKDIRMGTGMSRPKMSKMFYIPVRTIENWEGNGSDRCCPEYVKMFIAYTIFNNKKADHG